MTLTIESATGDLLETRADALVNPWNRNFVPRWLLNPGGVSGQLKARTGPAPWEELARHGVLELGQAVVTSSGNFSTTHAIIHVAGLHWHWRASSRSIKLSIRNAVDAASRHEFDLITVPLIGAGHGHLSADTSRHTILTTLHDLAEGPLSRPLTVRIMELAPQATDTNTPERR